MAIIAGGKGTRLSKTVGQIPKCLVEVAGKTVLQRQLEMAKSQGVKKVFLLTGHLSEQVEDFVATFPKENFEIQIVKEDKPLGTAGCFHYLSDKIDDAPLMILYGDVICDLDIQRMYKFHKEKRGSASLLTHPNNHPYDSDLIAQDKNSKITKILRKPHENLEFYQNIVNAGAYIVEASIIRNLKPVKSDWMHDIFFDYIKNEGEIYSYLSREYIKDMGTPDRLEQVEKDILSGKVAARNLKNSMGAVFIDRDGTINEEVDNCSKIDDFVVFDFAAEAIGKINQSHYLAVVITNQPVLAKGFCTEETLTEIHKKMETVLGNKNSFIDGLYYCPHHPESGFEGEVPELKVECNCRKPEIGMIEQAVKELNIDLEKSYFIGDTTTDMETGNRAGIKTILVDTGHAGSDKKFPSAQVHHKCNNLSEAVNFILKES